VPTPEPPAADPRLIVELANAFFGSCVLFTASDAGVFRRLSEQDGLDAATLARDLSQSERGMRALADACVGAGLLLKNGDRYSLTPTARTFLTPGSPADLSGAIRYNRDVYGAWGRLPEFVRTGQPVERPELHLGEDRERTRAFVMAMHGKAVGMGRAILPMLDLAGRKRLLDVGGGPGTIAVLIAQAFPEIHCTVLDLAAVVEVAAELIERQGAAARVGVLPGDYHTAPFPAGLDAVNFFGMLHQESPEGIAKLIRKAYHALEPGGVVHVMDMMTDESHTQPPFSAMFALTMGLMTQNGWVFSSAELRGWLEAAGFIDFSVRPLPSPLPHWLARARKP
jgi:SAM-dependent methyltransferase